MNFVKKIFQKAKAFVQTQAFKVVCFFNYLVTVGIQTVSATGSNQSQVAGALDAAAAEITNYIPSVQKVIYAIAGVVALVGAIQIYIKMNNGEQDVSKSIMMLIGSCIFLVAAAWALPKFFA